MRKWLWLDEREAIATHDRLMILHGGITGLRDRELLLASLARPQHLNTYNKGVDAATLAAAYTFAIVKNHPFADGNKRTGFVLGILFLELNGARFTASEEAAALAVIKLASGELDEAGYAAFLKDNAV